MDWQARYYPLDVFQSLEQKIELMIQSEARAAALAARDPDAGEGSSARARAAPRIESSSPVGE